MNFSTVATGDIQVFLIRNERNPERVLSGEWNKAYGMDRKGRQ